jgi:tRNA dimethylallyltransferase
MEIVDILLEVKNCCENFLEKFSDWTIIIWWATATWKSSLSLLLSDFFPVEIISADSRQIFRWMDIWTDKVSLDWRKKIPHYQIDIVNPDETYTAWQRKFDVENEVEEILEHKKHPIIVWWTGLYLDTIYKNFQMPECAPNYQYREELQKKENLEPWYVYNLLKEVDPEEASKLHQNATRYIIRALEIYYETWKTKTELYYHQPVKHPLLMLWLWREKEETNMRINVRIKEMLKNWLIDEVKWLLDQWYSSHLQSMQWIGYKEVVWYIQWEYDYDMMEELLRKNTHYLAKKQRTRFRRYIAEWKQFPRDNVEYEVYYL